MFTNIYHALKILLIGGFVVLIGLLNPSSSLAEIGGIQIDREVKNNFEAYRFDSGYRYYFLGLENNPFAVIGLQKNYIFKDISWAEVDPNSEKFKHVIELIKRFPKPNRPAIGAYLLDGEKKTIGAYYSGASVGLAVDNTKKTVFMAVNPGPSSGRP